MFHDREDEDPGLSRLLRAVRADADPALWTRVRARIEARQRVPVLFAWAMRPAALAASLALLVASTGLALVLAPGSTVTTGEDYTTLTEALLAERDAEVVLPDITPEPAGGAVRDSGSGM